MRFVSPRFAASPADLLAGLVVAGVLLPEAVAYAAIAGVPAFHALIAALIGLVVYSWLGGSRFAIVAPTSSAAAVFAPTAAALSADAGFALVLVTGALFIACYLMRAGFLGAFISRPVLRGFAWALTATIIVRQLPAMLGLTLPPSSFGALCAALWQHRLTWHSASLALATATLLAWFAIDHFRHRLPVPTSLLVLAAGITLAYNVDLTAAGIAEVGPLTWHWSPPSWPHLPASSWLTATELAPALLLILFAESWGASRALALQAGDAIDVNRELKALGVANIVAGLWQGLPVGAGLSAAVANQQAGAASRRAGLVAAWWLALMLATGSGALAHLPQPVLAAVVAATLSHGLAPRPLLTMMRQGGDGWLALVAAAAVFIFNVSFGMLIAVGLSLLLALRRFAEPVVTELGQLNKGRDFVDWQRHVQAQPIAGLLIARPEEPLFFANCESVLADVDRRATAQSAHVVVLSLEVTDGLDTTAAEALFEFQQKLAERGAALRLARVKDRARDVLNKMAAQRNTAVPDCFWSVADAVDAGVKGRAA